MIVNRIVVRGLRVKNPSVRKRQAILQQNHLQRQKPDRPAFEPVLALVVCASISLVIAASSGNSQKHASGTHQFSGLLFCSGLGAGFQIRITGSRLHPLEQ